MGWLFRTRCAFQGSIMTPKPLCIIIILGIISQALGGMCSPILLASWMTSAHMLTLDQSYFLSLTVLVRREDQQLKTLHCNVLGN